MIKDKMKHDKIRTIEEFRRLFMPNSVALRDREIETEEEAQDIGTVMAEDLLKKIRLKEMK